MRQLVLCVALGGLLLGAGSARAQFVVNGNDTGGIIAWSPEIARYARAIAADHCATYAKYARITSWHARYGDYIGFGCEWRPRYRGLRGVRTRY
jgi:hypothetical protein